MRRLRGSHADGRRTCRPVSRCRSLRGAARGCSTQRSERWLALAPRGCSSSRVAPHSSSSGASARSSPASSGGTAAPSCGRQRPRHEELGRRDPPWRAFQGLTAVGHPDTRDHRAPTGLTRERPAGSRGGRQGAHIYIAEPPPTSRSLGGDHVPRGQTQRTDPRCPPRSTRDHGGSGRNRPSHEVLRVAPSSITTANETATAVQRARTLALRLPINREGLLLY